MKKLLLLASAASMAAAIAAPAFATPNPSVTGTVDVTGTVTASCSATGFHDTITLGELEATDGTLDTALPNNSGLTKSFTVLCNSGKPTVDVVATRLTGDGAGATTGFTNVIDYTATATATLADGTTTDVAYTTAAVPPAHTVTPLAKPLRNPAAGTNLAVALSAAHTTNASDVLTAGTYTSTITVNVAPTD